MQLFEEFAAIAHRREARLICAGGIREHVHLLVAWSPALALSDLVRDLKTWSSQWVHRNVPQCPEFRWQGSFTVYTARYQRLGKLVSYTLDQEQHHGEASRIGVWLEPGWKDLGWSGSGTCPLCGKSSAGRGQSPRLRGEHAEIVADGPGLQPGAASGVECGEATPRAQPAAIVSERGALPARGSSPGPDKQ